MDLSDKSLKLTKKRLEALNKLGLFTSDDLFCWYPIRYEILIMTDFSTWHEKDEVTFEGKIVSRVNSWRKGRLNIANFEVLAFDHVFKVTIFNRPWAKNLKENDVITIRGIYKGKNQITALNYDTKPLSEHNAVTPIYSTKEGIQQRMIRDSIKKVYETLENEIQDTVPEEFITNYKLLRRAIALRKIHFPESMEDVNKATRTIKYEEFLRYFTAIEMARSENSILVKNPKRIDFMKVQQVKDSLSFSLTKDQEKALDDILQDLSSMHVMYRLVQGDVGCGKTVIAALSMYGCVLSGYQATLLAPTEILARQHFISISKMLEGTGIQISLLYSGLSNNEKKEILEKTKDGTIQILIGTHALFQEDVTFYKLGYVVADEQQRFGVEQRAALKNKGEMVDFLLMSATPIPRTLATTLFGDLDVSTIETMPEGRKEPITQYIPENSFRSILPEVNALLESGHQLYVICAAVEENEDYGARDVITTAENLKKLFFKYNVTYLHGRMTSDEKQNIMKRFEQNEVQVLVSTTVVEVGMNVINAIGMIIYDADRFGLSQLHQLRGRIQRGKEVGHCWLLSDSEDPKTIERLQVLVKTNNGFEISKEDLRLRGPGDILGKRQSGMPDFILGNLIEDTKIIETAQKDAKHILLDCENPDYSALVDIVKKQNEKNRVSID